MKSIKKLSVLLFTLVFAMAELLSFSINAFAAEPTTIVNLSVGKSYTNIGYLSPSTPDTNGKELTDGQFGTQSNKHAAWNGTWHRATESGLVCDEWPLYTTVIDLGGVKSITSVEARFLRFYVAYAHMPQTIKVYASVDGENWMKLSYLNNIPWDIADGIYSFGWHVADHSGNVTTDMTGNANSSVRARYVRFDYESRSGYTLCDEITVMGYNGEKSGAITPYNTRKMENGPIMLADEQTGNIQDMVLIYQSRDWTKENFKPYLTYVDANGNSVDTLYDTALFLRLSSPDGNSYDREDENLTAKDWTDYLDQTFVGDSSTIVALNEAAKQASVDLGDPDYKANLVVMVPFPSTTATGFGELGGRTLDLSVEADWKYAIDWYLNQVISYVNNGNYQYIDFKGFYWVNEYPSAMGRIVYTNQKIDSLGYKSYWIPYFHSTGYFWNEDLGFSALTLQPNHFFDDEEADLGAGGTKIIETVAKLGAVHNFGVEFEFDGRFFSDVKAYNRFLDYLNAAVKMGFDGPGYFRNWYEAGGAILQIYNSRSPEMRMLYDNIYQMIKGDYVQRDYITAFNENLLLGKSYTHNATNWYADRCDDSACTFLTDGVTEGNYYGSDYFGVKNEDATIEFDFSNNPISFRELHILAMSDSKSGVYLPENIKISAKSPVTSEWNVIYDGAFPSSGRGVFRTGALTNAAGLKFEFTTYGAYLFLKEILAYDYVTNVKSDIDIAGSSNILAGKTYTHNVTNWYNGSSRDSGTALTDGVKDGSFYGTDYLNAEQKNVTVEFDLGAKTKISEINLNSLEDTGAAVYPPKSAKIYFKADEYTEWELVYDGAVGKKDFVFSSTTAFDVSKIRMEFENNNAYIFLKEIEAYSFASTLTPDGTLASVKNLIAGLTPANGSSTITTFAEGGTEDMSVLTDGVIKTDAGSYKDNITFSDSPVRLVYANPGMKFKEVNIRLNNPADLNVRSISGLKIEKYADGVWTTIANKQDIPDYTVGRSYAFVSDEYITADKIRITLTRSKTTPCDWNGISVSEIQVLGEVVTAEPLGTFVAMKTPEITTNFSETLNIYSGDAFTLDASGTASDGGTISYQWYKDGAEISGATSHFYTVVNATSASAGVYTVKVTNSGALKPASAEASVNVVYGTEKTNLALNKSYNWTDYEGTTFASYPDTGLKEMTDGIVSDKADYYDSSYAGFYAEKDVELVIDLGSKQPVSKVNAVLMSTGDSGLAMPGKVMISYSADNKTWYIMNYWQQNDTAAKGVMVASAASENAPLARYVKVTLMKDGFAGLPFISEVQVFGEYREPAVAATPVIAEDLQSSLNVYEGNKLTLSVAASAQNGTLSYQWYKDGAAISGANAATYEVTADTSVAGNYKVVVTNVIEDSTASIESSTCTVTVSPVADTPVITKDLASSVDVPEGKDVMLSIEATAQKGTLTYQWYKDGVAISGAASAFYNVSESGVYKVVVTNTLDGTTSYAVSTECTVTVVLPVNNILTFDKDKVSAGDTFVMTFAMPETLNVSTVSLVINFDNTAFEILSIENAPYADMQPSLEGCNNNANIGISYCDPTYDANTTIKAGTALIQATFKVKDGVELGEKVFEISDWTVTGVFDEETFEAENITPDMDILTSTIEVAKPVIDALTFSDDKVAAGEEFVMTFAMPETLDVSTVSLVINFDNTAFEILSIENAPYADMQPSLEGCNNNANIGISYCDPTYDANTTIEKGTALIQATFKVKDGAKLGDKTFEISDWTVTGAFDEETFEAENITPEIVSLTKTVEIEKLIVDALTFSNDIVYEGDTFVMTFAMPETQVVSSVSLVINFDNTAFEILSIENAPYADMQPSLEGCNNNANIGISYCDPTYDANTTIEAGTALIQATFKAKTGNTGEKVFEISDWTVTGAFDEETFEAENITPVISKYIKNVEIIEKPGYTVSGSLTKSGSDLDATVELISNGETVATTTISGKTGTYTFETVASGTYTIKVSKSKHAVREYEIEVVDADVTQDLLIWLYGDINGDGIINSTDTLQMNRKVANLNSLFNQTANADYRFKVANLTAVTGTDILINSSDILQMNRKIANMTSIFDRIA